MKASKTLKTILLIALFGSMIATPVFAYGGRGIEQGWDMVTVVDVITKEWDMVLVQE